MLYQFKLLDKTEADVKAGTTNLFRNSPFKQGAYVRSIARIGIVGGATPADVTFDVFYGTRRVMENLCSAKLDFTGEPTELTSLEMISLAGGELCPAGIEIRIVANGAIAGKDIWCCIEFNEHPNVRLRGRN
jgi:hypothetical protein